VRGLSQRSSKIGQVDLLSKSHILGILIKIKKVRPMSLQGQAPVFLKIGITKMRLRHGRNVWRGIPTMG
jgi:hypothetical protein